MTWVNLDERWKNHFIKLLHEKAKMSRDENTKVAAMIIDIENKVEVSSGWNCLPRGVIHLPERSQRPLKYSYVSHAEISALTNALRLNAAVKGHTMLVTMACCNSCTCAIINSGIFEVVSPEIDYDQTSCGDTYQHSLTMMQESGVLWTFDNNVKIVVE